MFLDTTPLALVENEDLNGSTGYVYTVLTGDFGSPPVDLTAYTCTLMVRVNANDVSPVMTLTPVLGGTAGTITIRFSAATNNALVGLLPNLEGFYDCLLIDGFGTKDHFIPISPLTIRRSITR